MRNLTYPPLARTILAVAGSLLAAAPGSAQETAASPAASATPVTALDAVTVVGSVDDLQSLDFYAPNSSIVLKRQDIEDQGARKLDQALQYQAGILAEPFGADNKVEWFKIRGFDASMSLDGTPTTPNGFFVWKPELFGVESVEVLKGPSSLVFGASDAGGVVNLVTKRPRKEESVTFNVQGGHRNRFGIGIDYNGIANREGTAYYRIVMQTRRESGTQRRTNMTSYYLAPSATFELTERTTLTLLSSIQREDGRPTNGFLSGYGTIIDTPYGKIDRRLNAGEPDFDHLKRTQVSAGWLLRHELSPDWAFTQNYKFSRLSIDQQNVFAYGSDNLRTLKRGYSYTKGNTRNHYIDNRFSGKLRLGDNVELLPTIGLDYLKSDTTGRNNGFGMVPGLDMFTPVYGAPFPVTATPYNLHNKQLGIYASAQLRLGEHWEFTAGIRHDRAKSNGNINNADSSYNVNHNSFNVGAMYISDLGVSPYISYSESFKPLAGVDGYGNTYRPYEARQTEVGLKMEPSWLDGNITLAYFDLEEKNALIPDVTNIQTQSGKRTNKGIELQGNFNLTPDTQVKASYTRNRSRQDISAIQTVRTPLIPRHQASLWVSHRFNVWNDNPLTVAAGARYNGSTVDEINFPGERVPSYTLIDLMLRYEVNRDLSLQLNARNLTNKTYVSGCDFYCYYGGERTVDLQLQYRWQ